MGGYQNGGDLEANATSTDAKNRLGGSGSPNPLTTAEIAVIVVTIIIFIMALLMVFYCRKLQARRNIDVTTNQYQNNSQIREGDERPLTTPGGESIELKDGPSNHHPGTAAYSGLFGSREPQGRTPLAPAPPSADISGQKPPLWKYIHWKGPNSSSSSPLPRVEPRRDTRADVGTPPNPHYE